MHDRTPARLLRGLLVLALVAGLMGTATQEAAAYPASDVDFVGRGWGHGRGMGQWGSLGYALDHGWGYERILDHFYGGTVMGTIGNVPMSVRLTRFDERRTAVQQERGRMTTNAAEGETFDALRASRVGDNRFLVEEAPDCSGPWSSVDEISGPVTFEPTHRGNDRRDMLQVCEPSGAKRWLRGDVHAVDDAGSQRAVNHLPIELYLRGVVPRESPASWGGLGGGRGMHQLRAQAVAARSYAASENRHSYAKTCDTTACQVYGGVAVQVGSNFTILEHENTTQAILDTAGQVREHANGNVARTEFSASTGGWTAGGTFPVVRDQGDNVCSDVCNPHHQWEKSVPVKKVEEEWPTIGNLSSIRVTERNGHGAFGGRARTVRIEGDRATVTPSGGEVRSKLGLKSDWFRVLAPTGYWVVADDGGVFTFGNATFHGSMGGTALAEPIVGMAAHPSGKGYWMAASDGGVFSFGRSKFKGSMGGTRLVEPVVGMAATPSGDGYWMVASDGGIFTFGDAKFKGSMGGVDLVEPVVGMAPTKSGDGYWMVASDGGVFTFGNATFHGSMGGTALAEPIVGMARSPTGNGYWLVAEDGGIFAFGDAEYWGSVPGVAPGSRTSKVSMAGTPLPAG